MGPLFSNIEHGQSPARGRLGSILRSGASLVAICGMSVAMPAFAQDAEDAAGGDEIIVTGIKQSLANSQAIKRNADTVVDAITAEDIGALPDRSVTEALQRVPGVAINRFAGGNDPDHFSVEGSGVVIRGLNFVRSEFNGRDAFSANGGRSLGFSDVPAELLGSVEVYKNTTAELIEGGLAGTVNLNTRVPFDKRGFHVGITAELNYGDFAKKATPVVSVLVSNTWETGAGTFGLLGSINYSQLKSRADGMQVSNIQTRDGGSTFCANTASTPCSRNNLPSSTDGNADGFADLRPLSYAPVGANFRTQDYDRERLGFAFAGQWESTDKRALLTAQFLRSESYSAWGEHTFEAAGDNSEYNTYPIGCQQNQNGSGPQAPNNTLAVCPVGAGSRFANYQYDAAGVFENGYITLPGTGWRSSDSGGALRIPTGGTQQVLARREVKDKNVVSDYGLNFKFRPDDNLSINVDGQYTKAEHDVLDFSVFGSTFADTELDLRGNVPQATLHKPNTLNATWATPNARIAGQNDSQFFGDPGNYFWRAAMDHAEQSVGEEWAFKADIAYDFQDSLPFIRKVKLGGRYSDRDQTVRYTKYNWGVLSEIWNGSAGPVFLDQGPGVNSVAPYEFDNFFRGAAKAPPSGYFYTGNLIKNYETSSNLFKSINQFWGANGGNVNGGWVPVAQRQGVVAGTPFLPADIQTISESTKAAYAMLSFGSDEPIFGGIRLDGNIGVRYVDTRLASIGSFAAPFANDVGVADPFAVRCAVLPPPPGSPPGTPPSQPGGVCTLGEAGYNSLQRFANGANFPSTAINKYDHFLPSLNLKFGLTDDLQVRFAASKVLTRPDIGYVRNFISVGSDSSNGFRVQANGGNPFLRPATAKQLDLSVEWYFARVGSITATAFHKSVKGFFYDNVIERSFTNNGSTQSVFVRGPSNFDGTGKVKGIELAYQQTYDFLPGILSGLGVNANYTYIKSKGLPNSFLSNTVVEEPGQAPPTGRGSLPLEGLSKHNVNATIFYEKGPVSLRAAYSWRSKFLQTARDVIFPYFPIFNDATGQLDASAFYSITPNIKFGVQASNLTNEVTKTLQQFTPGGLLGPRSYFVNDRRFAFALRGNF
jgi:TonB-dependent receptor